MAEIGDLSTTDASNTARFPEGQTPASVNNGARATEGLLARGFKDSLESNLTSTGSSNAYVVAANRTLGAYYNGFRITFKTNFANTGAATVNVDGLGTKNIYKRTTSGIAALESGDIQSGDVVDLIYDGTQFQILSAIPIAVTTFAPTDAQYVTLATSTPLSNERVLTAGGGITLTDGGAGSTITVSGRVAQIVNNRTGALATGTGQIPFDDTIPQSGEGTEFITLSITPTNLSSMLIIDIVLSCALNITDTVVIALFQDSGANAIAAAGEANIINGVQCMSLQHKMTAGTTSATVFKVRAGPVNPGTITVNGISSARLFGGIAASSLTITEVLP